MVRWSLLLLLAVACNDTSSEGACTLKGCGSSGVRIEMGTFAVADLTPAATSTAEIESCLNNQCSTIVIGELPASSEPIEIRGSVVVPGVRMSALFARASSDAISVVVLTQAADAQPFHDGDIYAVKITSADGRVLVDRKWSVDYDFTYPNGPDCDPACAQPLTMTEQ